MIDVFCSSSRWSLGLLLVLCEVMLVKFKPEDSGRIPHWFHCACLRMCMHADVCLYTHVCTLYKKEAFMET